MIAASLAASTASAEEPAPPPDPGAAPGASVLELGDLRTQAVDQGTADVMVTVDPAAGDPAVAVETALAGTTFTTGHVIDDIVAVEVDAAGLEALSASPAVASVVEDRRLEEDGQAVR
jgi:hypothetical protein